MATDDGLNISISHCVLVPSTQFRACKYLLRTESHGLHIGEPTKAFAAVRPRRRYILHVHDHVCVWIILGRGNDRAAADCSQPLVACVNEENLLLGRAALHKRLRNEKSIAV